MTIEVPTPGSGTNSDGILQAFMSAANWDDYPIYGITMDKARYPNMCGAPGSICNGNGGTVDCCDDEFMFCQGRHVEATRSAPVVEAPPPFPPPPPPPPPDAAPDNTYCGGGTSIEAGDCVMATGTNGCENGMAAFRLAPASRMTFEFPSATPTPTGRSRSQAFTFSMFDLDAPSSDDADSGWTITHSAGALLAESFTSGDTSHVVDYQTYPRAPPTPPPSPAPSPPPKPPPPSPMPPINPPPSLAFDGVGPCRILQADGNILSPNNQPKEDILLGRIPTNPVFTHAAGTYFYQLWDFTTTGAANTGKVISNEGCREYCYGWDQCTGSRCSLTTPEACSDVSSGVNSKPSS